MGGIISRFFNVIVPIEPGSNKDGNIFTDPMSHASLLGLFPGCQKDRKGRLRQFLLAGPGAL
jgi:hypothetical protein